MNVTIKCARRSATTCLAKFRTFLKLCNVHYSECRITNIILSTKMLVRHCLTVYTKFCYLFSPLLVEPTFSQCNSVKPQTLFYYIYSIMCCMHAYISLISLYKSGRRWRLLSTKYPLSLPDADLFCCCFCLCSPSFSHSVCQHMCSVFILHI